jgi:hypothetical protein
MLKENRTTTQDANNVDITVGTEVICLNDLMGGDNDTASDWDIVKGETYKVSHLYDDDNLIVPMIIIEGCKNGAFMADRFQVK